MLWGFFTLIVSLIVGIVLPAGGRSHRSHNFIHFVIMFSCSLVTANHKIRRMFGFQESNFNFISIYVKDCFTRIYLQLSEQIAVMTSINNQQRYVFAGIDLYVSLFVSNITDKVVDKFL